MTGAIASSRTRRRGNVGVVGDMLERVCEPSGGGHDNGVRSVGLTRKLDLSCIESVHNGWYV